ncbi:MAG: ABC transporter permease [Clostridia bacterium]|nr:ABC transporter permease [Clostridia bacterium]
MRAAAIILKDIRNIARDRHALAMMIVQPMIIILVLGFALGPMFSGRGGAIQADVGIVRLDEGELARVFLDEFLGAPELSAMFTQVRLTEEEARSRILEGKLKAAIIIPEDFTARVTTGQDSALTVLFDPASQVVAPLLRGVVGSFATQVSATEIATGAVAQEWIKAAAGAGRAPDPEWAASLAAQAGRAVWARMSAFGPEVVTRTVSTRKAVSSFEYYSAGMGVMYLMFSMMLGAKSLLDERDDFTLMRLMSTPTRKSEILAGKLVSVFAIGAAQWGVLVVFTRLAYGVKWGSAPWAFLALSACTILGCAGLSVFLSTVSKSRRGVNTISSIAIQVISLLGGSMIPIAVYPKALIALAKLTPNYWAMDGFSRIFAGAGLSEIGSNCISLAAIGVLLFGIGTARLRLE